MPESKNKIKQATYAERKVQLNKALRSGFYFEAIFLEYAIMEDRTESVLRHAGGIKLTNKQDQPLKLSEKINKIRSCKPFQEKYIRKHLSLALLQEIDDWRKHRNDLVHYLMNSPTASDELQAVAEQGQALVRFLDNKVKLANNFFDMQNEE